MKYHLTTTIKRGGGSSGTLCIYILSSWGLKAGTEVSVELRRADAGDNDPVFTFLSTIRTASTTGSCKLTIPRIFGLDAGEWVTISILPIGI